MTGDREFERLEQHLRGSWLIQISGTIASAVFASADRSSTASRLRRMRAAWTVIPGGQRVRAVAAFVATAAAGHLLLLRFVPAHIAPALPQALWILVALTALVVAIAATPVTQAWKSSSLARLSAFVSRS